ncbi:spore gernimation protein KB [Anaerobacillus alkalidiazotrophicus]|uniref:Spore gernimation protein KB n=1 Tax=Anaerobacillus alkalidiazotrophicus TaxID=472963 RepID=A0A1S2MA70_9BACI|nr:GerAB/ArcD/ProY family transporter [Anaerobacillus alkalidiazotrophicus]OIJ21403.1 spore gernimation protein KB [Anaerobacillus alkalidiazotrophicus]
MEQGKINPFQLFVLMVLFELGSAIVISIGAGAEQGAWIAILLALGGGLIMYSIYYYLYKQYPHLPLTGYLPMILGKYLGKTIGVLYILYFFYICARVLRDFGDLLLTSTLPETPIFVINLLMVCTISYVLYLGIEVLSRTGEFFFFIILLFGVAAFILIVASGIIDLQNLLPILGNGWMPIITTAFPSVLTFPFGEVIVFTMLFPYFNNQTSALKVGFFALIFSGFLISITTIVNISVLGVDIANRAIFPLLTTVGKIRVLDFLERLDALVVVTLVVCMFFKIAIFFYVGLIGITEMFQIERHQKLILPIGLIILFCSLSIANNFSEHIEEGIVIVPYYIHLPFQVYIPIFLFIIVLIRKRLKQKN